MRPIGIVYFVSILLFINYLVFVISLYKIFEKEGYNPLFSLIPGLNYWFYLKICNIPVWTLFVPIANFAVLFFSTYCIAYQYRFSKHLSMLAVFFPFVFLPMIAFSNRQNVNKVYDSLYVKNISDIDKIENDLVKGQLEPEASNNDIEISMSSSNNEAFSIIDQMNNTNFQDQIIYDDDIIEGFNGKEDNTGITEIRNTDNEVIEISDIEIKDLSVSNLDEFESNMIDNNKIEQSINQNLEEVNNETVSSETIAFGGKEQIEGFNGAKSKNDELKCPRCGSSLIGANGFCPGCGLKL